MNVPVYKNIRKVEMNNTGKWGRGTERGCEAALIYAMARNRTFTAYQLARKTGFTPQHVNRVLKQMWLDGKCGYFINERVKGRKWGNLEFVEMTIGTYCWEIAPRGRK